MYDAAAYSYDAPPHAYDGTVRHVSCLSMRSLPKFTGKERDTETGLDYFGARYYGSNMGRWMSADWSATPEAVPYADLTDPQTLNLYGYVSNNPLSHPDSDGHQECFANGACNPVRNAYAANHWILNGLTNAASDLFSLDEVGRVARATVS